MAFVLALSGKGGTGKTTLAALMIRHLTVARQKAVLAVDADPNSCLGIALGAEAERTIADIREDTRNGKLNLTPGMSKARQIEYLIQSCVVEGGKFDLLSMGRPEGPKCYCYVNSLLRKYLEEVTSDYPFVVADNEAGMEHLSRRTTNNVDELFIVSEPTLQGARTVERIMGIAESLPITVKRKEIIVNRISGDGGSPKFDEFIRNAGHTVALEVPHDTALHRHFAEGGAVFDLPESSPALQCLAAFLDERVA